jgi:hypothetical protein
VILKEFSCSGCGDFEGLTPICPKCGKIGSRAFRTAPGYSTGGAKRFDRQLEGLIKDRGMTNYSTRDKNLLRWSGHTTTDLSAQWVKPGAYGIATGKRNADCSFEEYVHQPFQAPKFTPGSIKSDGEGSGLSQELLSRTRNKFEDPRPIE